MSVATGGSEAAAAASGGGGNRVFFQSPRGSGGSGGSSGGTSREDSVSAAAAVVQVQQRRHQQGKVTVKYDRKELRKRLVLEEWIVEQLGQLYGCESLLLSISAVGSRRMFTASEPMRNVGLFGPGGKRLEKTRRKWKVGWTWRGRTKEEEMPEVEIDIDDLLDAANEEERALKLQMGTITFVKGFLSYSSTDFAVLQVSVNKTKL
ncbi:hypothetical protein WISP_104826 [Willisornis vidua]|uniref:PP14C phosphatase n=1 Tax=Willisornis vidua TaxID=1566151 RepID=A0ABQ9CYE7_9PASS|nr:hypothetical protein WISP_104826 [Willisornis vidua]